jgi:two-component system, chemotaxis family, protein-glutamate methylesterase/glutaminase
VKREIVTIGGSAGSMPSLLRIVEALPEKFAAAVFVVLHLHSREKSSLPSALARVARIPAVHASDGRRIETGTIYVAPPDRHLIIAEGHMHLSRGPKEGLHRPSINVTFRSAAVAYGDRVVGVLLSGMLDDGASGLWDIANHGGISIIQDPLEAQFPSMPVNALSEAPVHFKLRAAEIGPRLVRMVTSSEESPMLSEPVINDIPRERFSGFTCPECHGPLFDHRTSPPEFICRVGHRFPLETLIEEATATQERKLYEAIVSLEEGADMAELQSSRAPEDERPRFVSEAKQLRRHALEIRKLIEERQTPAVDT